MGIEAVIFDWGGTLTRWHDIDFHAEAATLAAAVVGSAAGAEADAAALLRGSETVWARARHEHRSASLADVYAAAELTYDEARLDAYRAFWEPHTVTDPDVPPTWVALRRAGLRIGVLSNTLWPRAWHRGFFERDGVLDLVDGDVYTSEIAWTKPAPQAFEAAMTAVGVDEPARCVYVGDRLFDDIWGAANAGMRTIHVPHSRIPPAQLGHSIGEPDALADRLTDVPAIVAGWAGSAPAG